MTEHIPETARKIIKDLMRSGLSEIHAAYITGANMGIAAARKTPPVTDDGGEQEHESTTTNT